MDTRKAKAARPNRYQRAKRSLELVDDMAGGILDCFQNIAKDYPEVEVMDLAHLPHTKLLRVVAKIRRLVEAETLLAGAPRSGTDN